MFDIIGMFMLVVLIAICAWLVKRAWGSRRRSFKWVGTPLTGLLTLVLAFLLLLGLVGFSKLNAPTSHPPANVQVTATAEQISRGKYLSQILCAGCHSPDGELPLRGGKNLSDDIGLPLGSLYASNLTPAGDVNNWSDGEILRALRWGAHKSGRSLAMPSKATSQLSDADAQAIVAFLRSQSAVQTQWPSTSPSLLLGILLGAGQFDLSVAPDTGPVVAPPRGATVEYGQYVINIADCKACHGDDLAGGKPPAPPGPSLYFVRSLTKEQFLIVMRIGVTPIDRQREDVMPWKTYAGMDEVDLAALYTALHNLPLAQK